MHAQRERERERGRERGIEREREGEGGGKSESVLGHCVQPGGEEIRACRSVPC